MTDNAVAEVVAELGGLTAASVRTGVAASTWVRWRQKGWIDDARVLLEAATMTGRDPKTLAKPRPHVA